MGLREDLDPLDGEAEELRGQGGCSMIFQVHISISDS